MTSRIPPAAQNVPWIYNGLKTNLQRCPDQLLTSPPKPVSTLPCLLLAPSPGQGIFWPSSNLGHVIPFLNPLTQPKFLDTGLSSQIWLVYYDTIPSLGAKSISASVQRGSCSFVMAPDGVFGVFPFSAPHMGQLLQCAVGHQGSRYLHSWEAPGPGPDHHHGGCADLQRWVSLKPWGPAQLPALECTHTLILSLGECTPWDFPILALNDFPSYLLGKGEEKPFSTGSKMCLAC